ncbi:MAG TPA: hypothetical protein VN950_20215 [Terriglobales bacterium]|nr:hypothetical protein [Terriglobales bacterium]
MKFSKCTTYLIVLLGATFGLATRLAAMGNDDADKTGVAVAAVDADVPNSPSAAPSSGQASANGANPETSIRYGFEERFRFEGYNNADFNSAKNDRLNQFRMRTRPYVDLNFNEYLEGYVRMGWEGIKRTNDPSYTSSEQASPFTAGELWFDNAYLKMKKFPAVDNLSMQAGRFEIVKGDGWLFSDPSGLDGSREGYDNAVDLAYKFKSSKLELIGIDNPKYDEFFPVWNKLPMTDASNPYNVGSVKGFIPALAENGKQLQEWDQTAVGAYYTNRELKNTDIDAYTFYNKSYGDIRKSTTYMYLPDRDYTLFGGRAVQRVKQIPGLSLTGEGAYEAGTEDSAKGGVANFDIRAWGAYGYAKQKINVKTKPYVTAGYWALSGQNPNSRTVGNFDPLFQRSTNMSLTGDAPSWSEFYVYSEAYEEGSYYWTNLKMAQVESGFTPVKQLTFVGGYASLDSMQPFAVNPYHAVGSVAPAKATAGIFGTGTDRGQLAKVKLVYRITPSVGGYVNLEKFLPGDFYVQQHSGYWFRTEINYTFNRFAPFPKL